MNIAKARRWTCTVPNKT